MTDAEDAFVLPPRTVENAEPVAPRGTTPDGGESARLSAPANDSVDESPEPPPGQTTDAEDAFILPPRTAENAEPVAPRGTPSDDDAATASQAMRGNWFQMLTDDSRKGGGVNFEPQDDYVSLFDRESDGRGVRITVWDETADPDVHKFTFYNRRGKGKYVYSDSSMGSPYNLAEGHCFKFRIQLVDGNNVIESSTDYAQWRNRNASSEPIQCDEVE